MKLYTQVINHSAAPRVPTNAQDQFIGRDMKEPTLVINHLSALIVTTNVQDQAI